MVNGGARSLRSYSELEEEQPIARQLSREMDQSPTLESFCRRNLVSCFAMSCTLVVLAAAGLILAKTTSLGDDDSTAETVLLHAMGAKCYLYGYGGYSYGSVGGSGHHSYGDHSYESLGGSGHHSYGDHSYGSVGGRRLQLVVVPGIPTPAPGFLDFSLQEKGPNGARRQRVTQTIVAACRRRRSYKKKFYKKKFLKKHNDYHKPTYGKPTYGKPTYSKPRYLVQSPNQDASTALDGLPASNGSAQVQASEDLLAARKAARGIGPSSSLQTEQSPRFQRRLVGYGARYGGYGLWKGKKKHKKWFKRCPPGYECRGEMGDKWGHCEPLTCSLPLTTSPSPTAI